jgi:hypothetical protein
MAEASICTLRLLWYFECACLCERAQLQRQLEMAINSFVVIEYCYYSDDDYSYYNIIVIIIFIIFINIIIIIINNNSNPPLAALV